MFMVTKNDLEIDVQFIKDQCTCGALELIKKLVRCFPTHDLMNATKIIYPQYWEVVDVKVIFVGHLAILKAKFCHPKPKNPNVTLVVGLLDGALLDHESKMASHDPFEHLQPKL